MNSEKSFYAVHYMDENGKLESSDMIEAVDYWEACQLALATGAVEFQIFDGTPEEIEELALACVCPAPTNGTFGLGPTGRG